MRLLFWDLWCCWGVVYFIVFRLWLFFVLFGIVMMDIFVLVVGCRWCWCVWLG